MRRITPKGLVYTIDLSKIADRENPRTVEAPTFGSNSAQWPEKVTIDWGDGNTETIDRTAGNYYPHTYAEGAGDKFTVVIRSATGHLPVIRYNNRDTVTNPDYNITLAAVSLDHFAGWSGALSANSTFYAGFIGCVNLEAVDTRLIGQPSWSSLYSQFRAAGLQQPIESFCFDFLNQCTSLNATFRQCSGLTGAIPEGFFDNCISVTTLQQTFQGCVKLTAPYVFWNADGSINTEKLPSLTAATGCYSGCTGMDLAQIPSAYGGTMTVS